MRASVAHVTFRSTRMTRDMGTLTSIMRVGFTIMAITWAGLKRVLTVRLTLLGLILKLWAGWWWVIPLESQFRDCGRQVLNLII